MNKSSRVHVLMIKVGKRDWGQIEGSGARDYLLLGDFPEEISLRAG